MCIFIIGVLSFCIYFVLLWAFDYIFFCMHMRSHETNNRKCVNNFINFSAWTITRKLLMSIVAFFYYFSFFVVAWVLCFNGWMFINFNFFSWCFCLMLISLIFWQHTGCNIWFYKKIVREYSGGRISMPINCSLIHRMYLQVSGVCNSLTPNLIRNHFMELLITTPRWGSWLVLEPLLIFFK